MLSQAVFFLLFGITVVVATGWGGQPERMGAFTHIGLFLVQAVAYLVLPPQFLQVDNSAIMADALGLAAFGWIALSANRIWPIWAASLQLLSMMGHFARWAQIEIGAYAYVLLKSVPTAVSLLVLLIGVIAHRKRLTRIGTDPSWVDWKALRVAR